jgi:hypothetical protein
MRVNYASEKDKFKIEVGDLLSNFGHLGHEGLLQYIHMKGLYENIQVLLVLFAHLY